MISDAFTEWPASKAIAIRYLQPGKRNQNAFINRVNRNYRTEVLDEHRFPNLGQVQAIPKQRLVDYNEYRLHDEQWLFDVIEFNANDQRPAVACRTSDEQLERLACDQSNRRVAVLDAGDQRVEKAWIQRNTGPRLLTFNCPTSSGQLIRLWGIAA